MMIFLLLASIYVKVFSECPNACSAHGRCGAYDMCNCYRNWMANDCSQRICPFGLAHVDTPKGDLNSDGVISGPEVTVVKNSIVFPYGVQEEYPQMTNTNGREVLDNAAHEYVECSNKGKCNRNSGTCVCLDGYNGNACQYLSCPIASSGLECNGKGVCETAVSIAKRDSDNDYFLWDRDSSMGCVCDPGYYGPTCEQRRCKQFFDPIFFDTQNSLRFSNWSFVLYSTSASITVQGNYSIVFYDSFGQDWHTEALDASSDCSQIVSRLEQLPGHVIPPHTVRCLQWLDYHSISSNDESVLRSPNPFFGRKTTLVFPSNPGPLKQIDIDTHLDGNRPSLFLVSKDPITAPVLGSVGVFVYPDGFSGEALEYFPTKCLNVDVTLSSDDVNGYHFLSGLTSLETRLLKQCLGDSDGYPETYSEELRVLGTNFTWDFGDKFHPHLIRLVDLTDRPVTDLCNGSDNSIRGHNSSCFFGDGLPLNLQRPPGFLVPVVFDPFDNRFKVFTRIATDFGSVTVFSLFTTTGTVQMVSDEAKVFTDANHPYSNTVFTRNSSSNTVYSGFTGQLDCESNPNNDFGSLDCIEKHNLVFFLDPSLSPRSLKTNPKYLNLYSVDKIGRNHPTTSSSSRNNLNFITLDKSINSEWLDPMLDSAKVYLFKPDLSFQYVSECSNRGLCDDLTGICHCFDGFTSQACSILDNVEFL